MDIHWDELRRDIIGRSTTITTPYGERLLTYADYTASGRGLYRVEQAVQRLLEHYANTHTEDDSTGRITSRRLAQAEALIRRHLNADEHYKLLSLGAGATAAVTRLQQILGVYISPATRERLRIAQGHPVPEAADTHLPVVFVGPYEHHSNEISWREGLCQVVEVELTHDGYLSLSDLERKLSDPQWDGRTKIGSFSAASNVSGIRTPVYEVARILHRHQALAFFDFSASAPYVEINVRRDDECYFDGVFFSPHKFLGGPGASGILLIREDLYRRDLPPSVSGGGTVRFVNARTQDYVEDIEEREKAGTPGILQTIRAALAMDLQHQLGRAAIERREQELIRRAFERLDAVPQIEIIGDAPAEHRLSILSFNLRAGESYLHPRFVVRLLNDLFGIQSRAGCSCAGPYGHRLLHIDIETSERYRRMIRRGDEGIKPGWVRLNFHYLIDDDEFAFLLSAIEFVAEYGELFLQEYRFDLHSGAWVHRKEPELESEPAMDQVLASGMPVPAPGAPTVDEGELSTVRRRYLKEAQVRASQLKDTFVPEELHRTPNELIPFSYLNTVSS